MKQRHLVMPLDDALPVDGYERHTCRFHDEERGLLFGGNAVFRGRDDQLLNALAAPFARLGEIEGGASYVT
ncbi:hypothetical protein EAE32_09340 [Kocuria tytonicola]|uniref:Uncharacterized protein n=1 Tax=Kocuria tytonicola TaxID=2055946 RepID=A0A3L9KZR9_9MICC|nr:hypothetical protein EAE32_09340 [Kocuria tytonicola]